MKYLITLLAVLLIGCGAHETKIENNHTELDSILTKSQQHTDIVNGANQKSDSLIGQKVEKTVQKIGQLETQVKELKAENNELKIKLNDATDNGKPYSGLPISNN